MNSIPTDIRTDVKKDADAIIRVCSYHRRDFDLVVVRSRPHDMHSVQTSLQAAFETLPTAKLGIFDHLPVELIFWCSVTSTFVLSSTSVKSTGELASYQPDSTNINWSPSMAWRACEVYCAAGLLTASPLSTFTGLS
ncbi:hypothetical protein V8F33_014026 [Rhypophila sp. PSN 637]